jgi:DNA-binding GntR family transcriptional regulator
MARSLAARNGRNSAELIRMTSGELAARHIRTLIFEGTLPPGSRIALDEIARALGISRIPLREALIALEREGWVTLEMHRGAFVNPLDEVTLFDHYSMLGLVYGFAVRRAIARADASLPQKLTVLRDLLAAESDPSSAGEILRQFHETLVDSARCPRVAVLLRTILSLIPTDIFTTIPQIVDVERPSIEIILGAVVDGNGNAAADAYAEMLRQVGRHVAELFRERNLLAARSLGSEDAQIPSLLS